MKRTFTLILTALLAAMPIVSCGGAPAPVTGDETTLTDTETTEAPSETSGVPVTVDLKGETISIWYTTNSVSVAETYVDLNPELTGDVIDDTTFNMNKAVESKLNCTLEFVNSQVKTSDTGAEVEKLVLAGDDTYDLYHVVQWNGAKYSVEGYYRNMADAPYISYDKPWWDYRYMKEMTIGEDKIFCLSGDFGIDRTRCLNCFYYNKSMYNDFYKNPDGLYQEVLDGKWTWDLLRKISTDVYSDLNNDSKTDREDRLGFCVNDYFHLDSFFYATGARVTGREKDDTPKIILNSERNATILQDLYKLVFETEGVYFTGPDYAEDVLNRQHFSDGNSMFLPGFFYSAEALREMKQDYGIIPFPKYNEEQSQYYSDVHDIVRLMVVPVTCQKVDEVAAVLEEMAFYGYNNLVPAFYDVVMKGKYARDEVSAEMLDLIRDNCSPDLAHIMDLSSLGYLQRKMIQAKTSDFASTYAQYNALGQEKLDDLIKLFKENT